MFWDEELDCDDADGGERTLGLLLLLLTVETMASFSESWNRTTLTITGLWLTGGKLGGVDAE